MNEIRVLQLGTEDWKERYRLPEQAQWVYAEDFTEASDTLFDIVFLDRQPREQEYAALRASTRAHTLFVTERVAVEGEMRKLCECKCGQMLQTAQIQEFLTHELRFFFAKSYGEKYLMENLTVAERFHGSVRWNGNQDLTLEGSFGDSMNQVAFWRNRISLAQNQVLDYWLEYEKDPQVEIMLEITQFASGSLSTEINRWTFDEKQMEQVVHIEGNRGKGTVFASILAKGEGRLRLIALHNRYSRGSHGHFLPGGVRRVTSKREELFSYFDPGDMKPPLNVYFSGYKQREGFEGYYLMRGLGSPFLLIAEARLEGGCYYMGSEEYEGMVADAIRTYMEKLGFSPDQVIFSGLSMGTTGALYYGCEFCPHAIIVGKPLANIGTVSANEQRARPGGFPTSLDMLRSLGGGMDDQAVLSMNQKFWKKFDSADWNGTIFAIAYMLEDDYDPEGYVSLREHLQFANVQLYGKGIHGRHNDNTRGIVQWFVSQYREMLAGDFGREVKK